MRINRLMACSIRLFCVSHIIVLYSDDTKSTYANIFQGHTVGLCAADVFITFAHTSKKQFIPFFIFDSVHLIRHDLTYSLYPDLLSASYFSFIFLIITNSISSTFYFAPLCDSTYTVEFYVNDTAAAPHIFPSFSFNLLR